MRSDLKIQYVSQNSAVTYYTNVRGESNFVGTLWLKTMKTFEKVSSNLSFQENAFVNQDNQQSMLWTIFFESVSGEDS